MPSNKDDWFGRAQRGNGVPRDGTDDSSGHAQRESGETSDDLSDILPPFLEDDDEDLELLADQKGFVEIDLSSDDLDILDEEDIQTKRRGLPEPGGDDYDDDEEQEENGESDPWHIDLPRI